MFKFVYLTAGKIRRNRVKSLLVTVPLFVLLNLVFSLVNNLLHSPLFFDSIFTAAGAVCFGPLAGTAVAVFTNIGMELIHGMNGYHWPFMLCSISTALILGFMAKGGFFSRQIHLTVAVLSVALANAVAGTFVAQLFFSGNSGAGIDVLVSAFTETGLSVLSSAFLARLPVNLIDKMIAVYAAFGFSLLPGRTEPVE